MAACDRTYPRYICKKGSFLAMLVCSKSLFDEKWVQYVDEVTGTVCSESLYRKCGCIVGIGG